MAGAAQQLADFAGGQVMGSKGGEFLVGHGEVAAFLSQLKNAVCCCGDEVLHMLARKQRLELSDVVAGEKLLLKVADAAVIAEILLAASQETSVQVAVEEDRVHGQERRENHAAGPGHADGLVQSVVHVAGIVEVGHAVHQRQLAGGFVGENRALGDAVRVGGRSARAAMASRQEPSSRPG